MTNSQKVSTSIKTLKSSAEYFFSGEIITEEDFNKIDWVTGVKEDGITAITSTTNPHSEITWEKFKTEMDKIQAEDDSLDYARKRKAEYPTIEELVVALYDTEDRAAIDEKRAAVKLKHPKGV